MKRNLINVLVVVLLFIVSGCSNNDTKPSTNQKEEVQTQFTINSGKLVLEKKEVIANRLEILIPQTFSKMSEEMAKIKYPSERRPTVIFTNENASINIAFNHTQNEVLNEQINEVKNSLKESFSNLYPSATWYDQRVETISGKNVGIMELLTSAIDTKIYNLIFFFELDGKLMLGTFNCTEKEMEAYKPVASNIVKSLIIK